jgi:hypothetical protein
MEKEARLQAALTAFNLGQFKSLRQAAAFHDVAATTLTDRYHGRQPHSLAHSDSQLLSPLQEDLLAKWCLDLEIIQQAPSHTQLREMAILILRNSGSPSTPGKNWVRTFLARNTRVKTKLGRAIDGKRT